jgi:hypothetical protein
MATIVARFERGPITGQVVETVLAGQLVEARAAGKVGVAGAASNKVLGVALQNAAPPASESGTTSYGAPVTDISLPGEYVSIAKGWFKEVSYSAAAAYGDPLVATATGKVAPAGAAPDARTIVGRCWEPAGVALGATGLTEIF